MHLEEAVTLFCNSELLQSQHAAKSVNNISVRVPNSTKISSTTSSISPLSSMESSSASFTSLKEMEYRLIVDERKIRVPVSETNVQKAESGDGREERVRFIEQEESTGTTVHETSSVSSEVGSYVNPIDKYNTKADANSRQERGMTAILGHQDHIPSPPRVCEEDRQDTNGVKNYAPADSTVERDSNGGIILYERSKTKLNDDESVVFISPDSEVSNTSLKKKRCESGGA